MYLRPYVVNDLTTGEAYIQSPRTPPPAGSRATTPRSTTSRQSLAAIQLQVAGGMASVASRCKRQRFAAHRFRKAIVVYNPQKPGECLFAALARTCKQVHRRSMSVPALRKLTHDALLHHDQDEVSRTATWCGRSTADYIASVNSGRWGTSLDFKILTNLLELPCVLINRHDGAVLYDAREKFPPTPGKNIVIGYRDFHFTICRYRTHPSHRHPASGHAGRVTPKSFTPLRRRPAQRPTVHGGMRRGFGIAGTELRPPDLGEPQFGEHGIDVERFGVTHRLQNMHDLSSWVNQHVRRFNARPQHDRSDYADVLQSLSPAFRCARLSQVEQARARLMTDVQLPDRRSRHNTPIHYDWPRMTDGEPLQWDCWLSQRRHPRLLQLYREARWQELHENVQLEPCDFDRVDEETWRNRPQVVSSLLQLRVQLHEVFTGRQPPVPATRQPRVFGSLVEVAVDESTAAIHIVSNPVDLADMIEEHDEFGQPGDMIPPPRDVLWCEPMEDRMRIQQDIGYLWQFLATLRPSLVYWRQQARSADGIYDPMQDRTLVREDRHVHGGAPKVRYPFAVMDPEPGDGPAMLQPIDGPEHTLARRQRPEAARQVVLIYHGTFGPFHTGHRECIKTAVSFLAGYDIKVVKVIIGFTAQRQSEKKVPGCCFANVMDRANIALTVMAEGAPIGPPIMVDRMERPTSSKLAEAHAEPGTQQIYLAGTDVMKNPTDQTLVVTRKEEEVLTRQHFFDWHKLRGLCIQVAVLDVSSTVVRESLEQQVIPASYKVRSRALIAKAMRMHNDWSITQMREKRYIEISKYSTLANGKLLLSENKHCRTVVSDEARPVKVSKLEKQKTAPPQPAASTQPMPTLMTRQMPPLFETMPSSRTKPAKPEPEPPQITGVRLGVTLREGPTLRKYRAQSMVAGKRRTEVQLLSTKRPPQLLPPLKRKRPAELVARVDPESRSMTRPPLTRKKVQLKKVTEQVRQPLKRRRTVQEGHAMGSGTQSQAAPPVPVLWQKNIGVVVENDTTRQLLSHGILKLKPPRMS
eukprot:1694412-Amphidinium_carterae.1